MSFFAQYAWIRLGGDDHKTSLAIIASEKAYLAATHFFLALCAAQPFAFVIRIL